MEIQVNKEPFVVEKSEYNLFIHPEFNFLTLLYDLGMHERVIGLIRDIGLSHGATMDMVYFGVSHGGYIPIKLSPYFHRIIVADNYGQPESNCHLENMSINIMKHNIKNIETEVRFEINDEKQDYLIINNISNPDFSPFSDFPPSYLLSTFPISDEHYTVFPLVDSQYILYVNEKHLSKFKTTFKYYLENETVFKYDNLIHLCMIVKNAGDSFENVLKHNLPHFDRWTILDTGSSDNTVEIIKKVLCDIKEGALYQEPFIDFATSRNRCLDLAGDSCKFLIMLDDTYMLNGNIRGFLETVRSDQFSDSFSMYIKSEDTEYASNRIIKSASKLRYIYKIHEVITPVNNNNVIIPVHHAHIFDFRSDYMEKRTMDRKTSDLRLLHEMTLENPDDSRPYYYLGQTYNLLKRYDTAYKYFMKRVEHPDEGFKQEKIDACFEAARLCNFKLNKPWAECEALYLKAYELDRTRPDSLYFIGIHYYNGGGNNMELAFKYFKEAHRLGYPLHAQYSLKPTLSFYFLPQFLANLSYIFNEPELGKEATTLFLSKNEAESETIEYYTMKCWDKIFDKCLSPNKLPLPHFPTKKPLFVILADGGFNTWTGSDIVTKGVGGSEDFVINLSKHIQRLGYFNVIVFCRCGEKEEIFEGVTYKNIDQYITFIRTNDVHTALISRYPEYLPVTYQSTHVRNVLLILHDLIPYGEVIIRHEKLKHILCLSRWHCDNFISMFPTLKDLVKEFNYGIDEDKYSNFRHKIKHRFIYSSFPHRGLLPLLQMWERITIKYPDASLVIHSDVDGGWVNSVQTEEMNKIRNLLIELQEKYKNIIYKGWTSKRELIKSWLQADIWFYPCKFFETFCLTALEAGASKTLAVSTNLAALQDTVGNRGIIIPGDSTTPEWQETALQILFKIMDDEDKQELLLTLNKNWAKTLQWENRANEFMKLLSIEDDNTMTTEIKTGGDSILVYETALRKVISYFSFMNDNVKSLRFLEVGLPVRSSIETVDDITITRELMNDEEGWEIILSDDEEKKLQLLSDFVILNNSSSDLVCFVNLIALYKILKVHGILIVMNYNVVDYMTYATKSFLNRYNKNLQVLEEGNGFVIIQKK